MTERKQNITIEAGDDVTIRDSIDIANTDFSDISGFGAQVTVAEYAGGPVKEQYTETDSRFSIEDATAAVVEAQLNSSDTENLVDHQVETYYYEIELRSAQTDHTVTTGTITINPSY